MAFLITGNFGLTRMPLWRIEVAPVPDITIPITLYGYGNGDDAEAGAPERLCDG